MPITARSISEDETPDYPRIEIDIRRSDIFTASVSHSMFSLRTIFALVALWALIAGGDIAHYVTQGKWVSAAVMSAGGFIYWPVVVVLLSAALVLLLTRTPGILGRHLYELRAEGLYELTDVNEALSK